MLALIHTGAGPADRAGFTALFQPFTEPEAEERTRAIYARLDELADAERTDPRVAVVAAELAACLPGEMASAILASLDDTRHGHWLATLSQELSPAQAECFRQLVTILRERT
jgi:hypothetical protein